MIREGKEEREGEDRDRQKDRQTDTYKHEMCVYSGDTM